MKALPQAEPVSYESAPFYIQNSEFFQKDMENNEEYKQKANNDLPKNRKMWNDLKCKVIQDLGHVIKKEVKKTIGPVHKS